MIPVEPEPGSGFFAEILGHYSFSKCPKVDRPFNSIDITYLPSKFNHVSGNTVHMINEKLPGKVVRQ